VFVRLDPGSGVPIYRQIVDGVRYSVASGLLSPGDALPSVRELAKTLGVNPTTIQKAYGELTHLGVIEKRHGKGTFVAESPPPPEADDRDRALLRELRETIVRAAGQGATRAEIEALFERALEEFYGSGDQDRWKR